MKDCIWPLKLRFLCSSKDLKPMGLAQLPCRFPFTGCCVPKPDVIFRLEQGQQPWLIEEESLDQSCPGELVCVKRMDTRWHGMNSFYSQVLACMFIFTYSKY